MKEENIGYKIVSMVDLCLRLQLEAGQVGYEIEANIFLDLKTHSFKLVT